MYPASHACPKWGVRALSFYASTSILINKTLQFPSKTLDITFGRNLFQSRPRVK